MAEAALALLMLLMTLGLAYVFFRLGFALQRKKHMNSKGKN
jgi:hypothetical protein